MDLKGMVHALQNIHKCLATGGVLIDIHPAGEMPLIFLREADGEILLGWMGESDYFIEYRQAHRAVAQALIDGLFSLEGHQEFIYETHARDIAGLVEFLKASWSDAVLEESVVRRAGHRQRQAAGAYTIVLVERVQILKLAPRRAA